MASLKICVQKLKKDGTWPVYIRVTHRVEKACAFDPFGHAGFDPSGKIRMTP